MAQPLGALHAGDEILDGLGIGQVALEGGGAHQQVLFHQPGDHLGLAFRHAEARTQPLGHLGAQHRMVPAAPFGDVVEQRRHIGHAAAADLVDQPRRARVISLEQALLDLRQQADRADGVLVDRVVVVHVELHLRIDAAEIGHKAAENIGLVHPAQRRLRVIAPRQHLQEQRVGARVLAHRLIDQPTLPVGEPHRLGVNFELFGLGELEDLDQPHRVLGEPVLRTALRSGRRGRRSP